jgi:DNA-binding transcriptional regulator LsrR (DeoR family)
VRYGHDVRQNVVKVSLPLTQQDLANFMGLTRETTGIELKRLEKSGVISYNRQNYIVRTDKLNELLDEDYESMRLIGVPATADLLP